jgi:hypothetical protein
MELVRLDAFGLETRMPQLHKHNNKQLLHSETYNYHRIFVIVLTDRHNHFIWWNGVSEVRCVQSSFGILEIIFTCAYMRFPQ